jgi:hypothetical protein
MWFILFRWDLLGALKRGEVDLYISCRKVGRSKTFNTHSYNIKNKMKTHLLLILLFTFFSSDLFAQNYEKWEDHDVVRFYEKKEMTLDYNSLDKDGNDIYDTEITYFLPTKVKDGIYEVEVDEKINPKLWQIKGTNIYILFRYNPYLYKYDEGILKVSHSSGTFYKKP